MNFLLFNEKLLNKLSLKGKQQGYGGLDGPRPFPTRGEETKKILWALETANLAA